MKALLIKNAPKSFVNFLVAEDVPFRYSYGEFIIEDTHHEDQFVAFCQRKGVRQQELDKMQFSIAEITCEN